MVDLDGAAAMRIVDQIKPDIILLDESARSRRLETCRSLKARRGLSNVLNSLTGWRRMTSARSGGRGVRLSEETHRD